MTVIVERYDVLVDGRLRGEPGVTRLAALALVHEALASSDGTHALHEVLVAENVTREWRARWERRGARWYPHAVQGWLS
jgi:hypothetical protein